MPPQDRVADRLAIEDLATSYAYAVDDRDWVRWEALFTPDGLVDYTRAGGIAGTPAEVAAWMPGAMAVFTFCLHTTSTHQVRFTGPTRRSAGSTCSTATASTGRAARAVRRGGRLRRRLRARR